MRTLAACLLLLAVLLPPKLWRAGLGASLWLDETYSLALTTHPVPDLVRITETDAHPPLYYLGLKAWLWLGRAMLRPVGAEPGILWARSLNVLLWAAAAVASLLVGRRLLGPGAGTLFGWAVAAGAAAAQMALDARSYGFAFPAVVVCYLALLRLAASPPGDGHRGGAAPWWAVYALAAAFALWSHLLAGLLAAVLALAWLALALRDGRERRELVGWAGANLAVVVLFLPWLLRAYHQWELMQAAAPEWMTPATLPNLLLSFGYWIPFGRLGVPTTAPFVYWIPVGVAAVLLPGVAAGLRGRAPAADRAEGPARPDRARRALRAAVWLGLGTSVAYVVLLWSLDRLGLGHVFHGPRYPLLAGGLWGGGLAGLALRGAGGRLAGAWVLLAPWLVAGLVGQVWTGILESRGGLAGRLAARGVREAYVVPPELLPFFRGHLETGGPPLALRPLQELPCDAVAGRLAAKPAAVLDLNPWAAVERPRERLLHHLVAAGRLAAGVRETLLDEHRTRATLYELSGLREGWCRPLCRYGFRTAPPPVPDGAAARALLGDQRRADGWGDLEVGPDLVPFRWGTRARIPVRFAGRLPPGRHVLHLVVGREPYPAASVTLRGRIEGGGGGAAFAAEVASGVVTLAEPVMVETALEDPVLVVEHPLWSPAEELGTDDPRRLSFQLRAAWLERSER